MKRNRRKFIEWNTFPARIDLIEAAGLDQLGWINLTSPLNPDKLLRRLDFRSWKDILALKWMLWYNRSA